MNYGALHDLRVLDLTDDSGRFATKLLAEAGADVVRLGRGSAGPPMRSAKGGVLDWWYDGGKLALPLDLDREDDRARFRELARAADLLIETERPGRLAKLGIDYADLSALNPRLVQVSLTAFGRTGPRADWRTSDLVAHALGGLMSVTGTPDAPLNAWGRQAFNTAGFFAAISALAALFHARNTGHGQHVDLSLHQSVVACTEHLLMFWLFSDYFAPLGKTKIAERQGALHWSDLYDVTACADGHCMISPSPVSGMPGLMQWLGADGLAEKIPAFDMTSIATVLVSLSRLLDVMREWTKTKPASEVFLGGQQRRLCFGQVLKTSETAATPQLGARGFFRAAGGGVKIPGPLFRLSDTPAPDAAPPAESDLASVLDRWSEPRTPAPAGSNAKRPLEGIRVLDFTWVLAGPYATRVLADLGAGVIKLQTEERSQAVNANDFPYFVLWNRSKRSATLNLKHPRAAELFLRLAEKADVVIDNFSAGVLDRLGIGYAQASARNPRIIYLGMAGCGQNGPWESFVTFAPTIQALSGITYLTNPPGRGDVGYGVAVTDHVSGLAGALAILEALEARRRTGRGQAIDLAQLEVGAYLVGPAFVDLSSNGREHHPVGNRDPFDDPVPNEVYRCPGDEWLAVTARDDRDWQALCGTIGRADLAADGRLATVAGRRAARATIDGALSTWAAQQDAEAAMRRLQAAGVPAGLVQNARDWFERDEQLAARRWTREVEHGVYGKLPVDVFPASFSGTPLEVYRPSPLFGEHNFEVYPEIIGLSEAEIAEGIADNLFW